MGVRLLIPARKHFCETLHVLALERVAILIIHKLLSSLALAATLLVVSSCAEDEQNRVLSYEKGTYLGKVDQSLSSKQLRELMIRSNAQRVY